MTKQKIGSPLDPVIRDRIKALFHDGKTYRKTQDIVVSEYNRKVSTSTLAKVKKEVNKEKKEVEEAENKLKGQHQPVMNGNPPTPITGVPTATTPVPSTEGAFLDDVASDFESLIKNYIRQANRVKRMISAWNHSQQDIGYLFELLESESFPVKHQKMVATALFGSQAVSDFHGGRSNSSQRMSQGSYQNPSQQGGFYPPPQIPYYQMYGQQRQMPKQADGVDSAVKILGLFKQLTPEPVSNEEKTRIDPAMFQTIMQNRAKSKEPSATDQFVQIAKVVQTLIPKPTDNNNPSLEATLLLRNLDAADKRLEDERQARMKAEAEAKHEQTKRFEDILNRARNNAEQSITTPKQMMNELLNQKETLIKLGLVNPDAMSNQSTGNVAADAQIQLYSMQSRLMESAAKKLDTAMERLDNRSAGILERILDMVENKNNKKQGIPVEHQNALSDEEALTELQEMEGHLNAEGGEQELGDILTLRQEIDA